MNTVTQITRRRQAIVLYAQKHGKTAAARRYNVSRQYKSNSESWSKFGNPDASIYNHDKSVDKWTTCANAGISNEFPLYPEQISDWVTTTKLDKILADLGTSCSEILSDSASVSVEPIFEAKIKGNKICGTVTDLAIVLGQFNG